MSKKFLVVSAIVSWVCCVVMGACILSMSFKLDGYKYYCQYQEAEIRKMDEAFLNQKSKLKECQSILTIVITEIQVFMKVIDEKYPGLVEEALKETYRRLGQPTPQFNPKNERPKFDATEKRVFTIGKDLPTRA